MFEDVEGNLEVQKPVLRQGRLDTTFASDTYWLSALIKGAGCVSMTLVATGNISGALAAYSNLTAVSVALPNGASWAPLLSNSCHFPSLMLIFHESGIPN